MSEGVKGGGGAQAVCSLALLFESIVFRQLRFFMRGTIWRVLSECRAAAVFWRASFMDHRPGVGWCIQTKASRLSLLITHRTPVSNSSSTPSTLEALAHTHTQCQMKSGTEEHEESKSVVIVRSTPSPSLPSCPKQYFHEVCEDPFRKTKHSTLNSVLRHKPEKYTHIGTCDNKLYNPMCEWTFLC